MEYQNKGYDDGDGDDHSLLYLPPGFRFHPTDEEIITSYLKEKVLNPSFTSPAIGDADFNKREPWDLPKKAKMENEKEWYYFCQRDRKYPTGTRTNRATQSGYWKATGKDKEIYKKSSSGEKSAGYLIGMKKTLVFYLGRAPNGEKTGWIMHEYRLEGQFSRQNLPTTNEWVVSRVFNKSTGPTKKTLAAVAASPSTMNTMDQYNNYQYSSCLPPLVQVPQHASGFVEHYQDRFKTYNITSSTSDNTVFNPRFSFKNHDPNAFPYLHQENITPYLEFQPQCKIEQYSSSNRITTAVSHASQDTGLTADAHTDISSSLDDIVGDRHGLLPVATMPDFSSLIGDDYWSISTNLRYNV